MAIVATLPGFNLFSSLPNDINSNSPHPPSPPIPVPKYPPPLRSQKRQNPNPVAPKNPTNPALSSFHRRTKYYKPVREGVVSSEGDRSVIVGESGVSYLLPDAPFEFQYSYSETPKAKPLAIREPAFLPFATPTMPRPWTGKAPLKPSKKKIPLFDSFNPPPAGTNGVKHVQMPGPFPFGKFPKEGKTREEVLGEKLKKWEIRMLVKPLLSDNKQVNLGRDGLTHNMLELVHMHWKRQRVCKVRCKGVPTVDMDNICRHLEEKTGGKIIHRVGGVLYLFRGRNYNYRTRPQYPVMLWKPAAPVYPKLIQEAPGGLTKPEADKLRVKGKTLLPICKLAKNGVYISLVQDVRHAFEGSPLVKIDCKGMHASDYKKLGAKLMELVPCVLLSFDDEQILMWRGRSWKSMYPDAPPVALALEGEAAGSTDSSGKADDDFCEPVRKAVSSSTKMAVLWKRALESSKAKLLDEIDLGPDDLLNVVVEFEGVSQIADHSYPALILTNEEGSSPLQEDVYSDGGDFGEHDTYSDDDNYNDENYNSDLFEEVDSAVPPLGSLPIDRIAKKLGPE